MATRTTTRTTTGKTRAGPRAAAMAHCRERDQNARRDRSAARAAVAEWIATARDLAGRLFDMTDRLSRAAVDPDSPLAEFLDAERLNRASCQLGLAESAYMDMRLPTDVNLPNPFAAVAGKAVPRA